MPPWRLIGSQAKVRSLFCGCREWERTQREGSFQRSAAAGASETCMCVVGGGVCEEEVGGAEERNQG